jgi:hypothetical protein
MRFVLAVLLGLLVFPASALALTPGDKVTYTTGTTARTGTLLVETPTLDLVARAGTVSTQDQVAPSVVHPAPAPTPTPTATPAPTVTPEPTPTPTPAPTGSFPDASNTGVPLGTTLTAYTGPMSVTTPGTVIDGKTITGEIDIDAPDVTIRNSKINGVVRVWDDTTNSLLLEDTEIDCGGGNTAIGEANYTVRRANIHGCENGFDMNQNIDVEDSYIHGLAIVGHDDGIQFAYGHFENGHEVDGARNLRIVHNTIFGHDDSLSSADGSFGTSAIIGNTARADDVLIQGNLMAGGAYTIYCLAGPSTNYRVLDNHFSTRYKPSVGFYGPSAECFDDTQSGNVIDETGEPIHLD